MPLTTLMSKRMTWPTARLPLLAMHKEAVLVDARTLESVGAAFDQALAARRHYGTTHVASYPHPSPPAPELPPLPCVTHLSLQAPGLKATTGMLLMAGAAFDTYSQVALATAASGSDFGVMLGAQAFSHVAEWAATWTAGELQASMAEHWRLALVSSMSGAAHLVGDVENMRSVGTHGKRMDELAQDFVEGLKECPRRFGAALVTGYFMYKHSLWLSGSLIGAAACGTALELLAKGVVQPRLAARKERHKIAMQAHFDDAGRVFAGRNKAAVLEWYGRNASGIQTSKRLDAVDASLKTVLKLATLSITAAIYASAGWFDDAAWSSKRGQILTGFMVASQLGAILATLPGLYDSYKHWASVSQRSQEIRENLLTPDLDARFEAPFPTALAKQPVTQMSAEKSPITDAKVVETPVPDEVFLPYFEPALHSICE